jgi:hypothetical protein
MNKFDGPDSGDFDRVATELQTMVELAQKTAKDVLNSKK